MESSITGNSEPSVASNSYTPKRGRRWLQFSLRTLLIVVTLLAVACGWLRGKIEAKRRERTAVSLIKRVGGTVYFDIQRTGAARSWQALRAEPFGPAWLRSLLGENFFSEIEFVGLVPRTEADDAALDSALQSLEQMPRLQFLYLRGNQFGDERIESLANLSQLKGIELDRTTASEQAVLMLRTALPNCTVVRTAPRPRKAP